MEPEKLDWHAHHHGETFEESEHNDGYEEFVDALRVIFEWIVPDSKRFTVEGLAARAMAVARALNLSDVRSESITQQAKRIGITDEHLGNLVEKFTKQWDFRVNTGKSPAAREIYRRARLARVQMDKESKKGPIQNELF